MYTRMHTHRRDMTDTRACTHTYTHTHTHTHSILMEQTKTHRSSSSSRFHTLLNADYSYALKF